MNAEINRVTPTSFPPAVCGISRDRTKTAHLDLQAGGIFGGEINHHRPPHRGRGRAMMTTPTPPGARFFLRRRSTVPHRQLAQGTHTPSVRKV